MNLCSKNHEEVCFEGRDCPCCELLEKVEDADKEISGLKKEIRHLEEVSSE